jgi:predicted aspartyl protease
MPAPAEVEMVALRRENGRDHIDVQLNGRSPKSMVLDPEAAQTVLPAALASRLGLKPTGRTAEHKLPDGSVVTADERAIATIRVGHLTAKDVSCVVPPEGTKDVAAVLGQSFLQHFTYTNMPDAGRLVLTQAAPNELESKPASSTTKPKASGRQPKSAKGKATSGKRATSPTGGEAAPGAP